MVMCWQMMRKAYQAVIPPANAAPVSGGLPSEREWAWIVALIFCLVAPEMLLINLGSMDELWSYQACRRILHHQVPYLDFNLIVSPFSAQLGGFWLWVFGDALVVHRILGILCNALFLGLIYQIARKTGMTALGGVFALAAAAFAIDHLPFYNYNWLALLFALGAMNCLLTPGHASKAQRLPRFTMSNTVLAGFLLGMAAITKQNTGLAFLAALLVYLGWLALAGRGRKPIRDLLRPPAAIGIGFSIPVAVEFMVIGVQGGLGPWNSFAGGGLARFYAETSRSFWVYFQGNPVYAGLAVLIPAAIVFMLAAAGSRSGRPEPDWNLRLLAAGTLAVFSQVIPLYDTVHLIMTLPLVLIGLSKAGSVRFGPKRPIFKSDSVLTERLGFRSVDSAAFAATAALTILLLLAVPYYRMVQLAHHELVFSSLPRYQGIPVKPEMTKPCVQSAPG